MNTYRYSTNYRKIYEEHHGLIPKEPNGRSYEIHHIDGDHNNNSPNNLVAVTLQEHYDIHFSQKDYGACLMMSYRMNLTPEEMSALGRLKAYKQIEEGNNKFADPEFNRQNQLRRVANGTHHLLGGKIQSNAQKKLMSEGRHNFQGKEITTQQLKQGTHPSQKRICCICCRKEINIGTFSRVHGNKCKNLSGESI